MKNSFLFSLLINAVTFKNSIKIKKAPTLLLLMLCFIACKETPKTQELPHDTYTTINQQTKEEPKEKTTVENQASSDDFFEDDWEERFETTIDVDRSKIILDSNRIERLQQKITTKEPLFLHALVPLCDNEHQGIVPVNSRLGDGQNLRTNLYWGAGYGVKSHFVKAKDWTLIKSIKPLNKKVLERVIFHKVFDNKADVYFIADAYAGDQMATCLNDYMKAISGLMEQTIMVDSQALNIYGGADLIIFNGHNGLMDNTIDFQKNSDKKIRQAAAIGCVSFDYFQDYFRVANCYPLITTTNLMAPEAYVLEALVNGFANMNEGEEIRKSIGLAYHHYQKCGVKGATRLFKTDW